MDYKDIKSFTKKVINTFIDWNKIKQNTPDINENQINVFNLILD